MTNNPESADRRTHMDRRTCKDECTEMAIMKERLNTEAAILRERLKTFTIVGTVSLTLTIGVIGWFDHRFNNVETKMEQLRSEIASENTKVHDDINSFRNRLNARGM